jgi:toxin secretion/phage lysis holin
MEKVLVYTKLGATTLLAFIASALGGVDDILILLLTLIVSDLITGLLYAFMTKTVSSTELRNGIFRKLIVILSIFIACKLDNVFFAATGGQFELFGVSLSIRAFFIMYSCLEEGISLVENLANIGMPLPKWLRECLIQVSDCVNSSTPREITNFIEKLKSLASNDSSGSSSSSASNSSNVGVSKSSEDSAVKDNSDTSK